MAVGSREVDKYNTRAELYDFHTDEWIVVQDYPYNNDGFGYYDMVYVDLLSAFIVIGGYDADYQNLAQIVMFQNHVWSPLGQLNTPRKVRVNSFFVLLIVYNRDIKSNGSMIPLLLPEALANCQLKCVD